jgi:hypothetical protein
VYIEFSTGFQSRQYNLFIALAFACIEGKILDRVLPMTTQQLSEFLKKESIVYGRVVEKAKITAE